MSDSRREARHYPNGSFCPNPLRCRARSSSVFGWGERGVRMLGHRLWGGRWRGRACSEDGAAAVEFALVLLPLTLLIFGIVQYGFYFFASEAASSAADSAARRVSV